MHKTNETITKADLAVASLLLNSADRREEFLEKLQKREPSLLVLICTGASLAAGQLSDVEGMEDKDVRLVGRGALDMALVTAGAVQSAYERYVTRERGSDVRGPVVCEDTVEEVMSHRIFKSAKTWAELEESEPILAQAIRFAADSITDHLCKRLGFEDNEEVRTMIASECVASATMAWDALSLGYDDAIERMDSVEGQAA